MRITLGQLRRIIKEEVQRSLNEGPRLMKSHVDEIEFQVERAQELDLKAGSNVHKDYLLNKLNGKTDPGEDIHYIDKNQLDGAAGLLKAAGLSGPGLSFDDVLAFVDGPLKSIELDPAPGPADPSSLSSPYIPGHKAKLD